MSRFLSLIVLLLLVLLACPDTSVAQDTPEQPPGATASCSDAKSEASAVLATVCDRNHTEMLQVYANATEFYSMVCSSASCSVAIAQATANVSIACGEQLDNQTQAFVDIFSRPWHNTLCRTGSTEPYCILEIIDLLRQIDVGADSTDMCTRCVQRNLRLVPGLLGQAGSNLVKHYRSWCGPASVSASTTEDSGSAAPSPCTEIRPFQSNRLHSAGSNKCPRRRHRHRSQASE